MRTSLHFNLPPTPESEDTGSDATFVLRNFSQFDFASSSFVSDPYYPGTSSSTFVQQANPGLVGVQHHSSAFVASDSSFGLNGFEAAFALLDATQGPGQIQWILPGLDPGFGFGTVSTEDFGGHMILQKSDGFPRGLVSGMPSGSVSILHAANADPRTSFLGSNVDESVQSPANFHIFPVADPPPARSTSLPEASFSPPTASTSNSENPGVWIDGQSFFVENIYAPMITSEPENIQDPHYIAVPTLEQQVISSREPDRYCGWTDEDGECGEPITGATLPGHLAEHKIKNQARNHPTMCKWIGCKTRKPINRESIVRHIREVHLGMKRPAKLTQNHCSQALNHRSNTC